MQDTRSRDECVARAETFVHNSDNDKRIAAENFSKRTVNYDNALRQRSLNRNTLGAIPRRAVRFVGGRRATARANAPARAAMLD